MVNRGVNSSQIKVRLQLLRIKHMLRCLHLSDTSTMNYKNWNFENNFLILCKNLTLIPAFAPLRANHTPEDELTTVNLHYLRMLSHKLQLFLANNFYKQVFKDVSLYTRIKKIWRQYGYVCLELSLPYQRSGCHVFKRISTYFSFPSSVWNEIRMK